MEWVGLPLDILERLERHGLSRDDRLLYVEGFTYAGQYLTDGVLTPRIPKLSDHPDPDGAATRLVEAGVWDLDDDGTYVISDYFSANISRDEIDRRKEAARIRQERSRRHKSGDHSQCIRGRYCPEGELETVTRDVTREVTRESRPTLPTSPYLPDLKGKVGKGEGKVGDDDGRSAPDGAPAPASPPHVYADPQRLGHCRHCNLPAKNAAHHQGAPAVFLPIADAMADVGPMVIEREFDTRDHWWQATIAGHRVTWKWETVERPLDQDDFPSVDFIDFTVTAHLTDDEATEWRRQADTELARYTHEDAIYGESDEATLVLSCATHGGRYRLPPLGVMRGLADQLLAFPEQVQP